MKVRAKVECVSKTEYGGGYWNVEFQPVLGEGNEQFTKSTPSGTIKLSMTKDTDAAKLFKVGARYYMDFSEAPYYESQSTD